MEERRKLLEEKRKRLDELRKNNLNRRLEKYIS